MAKTHERVKFRLIHTPCCGTLLCWVNPRLPNYCPECGKSIYGKLRIDPTHIKITDMDAELILASEGSIPKDTDSAENRIEAALAYIRSDGGSGDDPACNIERLLTGENR